eukprot:NODE_3689_length_863_cov_1.039402_g3667_i0.p2 GENE.NODE_3689_length_863_cov_1.039402_g3667_i0~~NODE_3689_length_863_cov_1.039402_g3667_i0.p2  ORF type:complete len:155 (+),score=5.07 NODE_3689_length_863_cov_1.039402_g3667_i0:102-566(+)
MGAQHQPVRPAALFLDPDIQPVGLQVFFHDPAPADKTLDGQCAPGQMNRFIPPRVAIAEPEGDVDQQDIKPEEAENRPGPGDPESCPYGNAAAGDCRHQNQESPGRQAPVRIENGIEECVVGSCFTPVFSVCHRLRPDLLHGISSRLYPVAGAG